MLLLFSQNVELTYALNPMHKRSINLTSPDNPENRNKKIFLNQNMAKVNRNEKDVFSWEKFSKILDEKLSDVARKTDLASLQAEIDDLKTENCKLKNDVKKLSSRLEFIDKNFRSTNIMVTGLNSNNIGEAKEDFSKLCSDVLQVNANVVSARVIVPKKSFCFSLESYIQAHSIIAAKNKLRGRSVYMQRDYTENEQNVRYKLRCLSKQISNNNKSVRVRLGEFCIYVNHKRYTWGSDKVLANSRVDEEYLKRFLAECNCKIEVGVKSVGNKIIPENISPQ